MAGRFDGTIRIDSSIDGKGFNKGVDGMTKKFKDVDGSLLSTGKTGKKSIGLIVTALEGMAVALGVTLVGVTLVTVAIVAAGVAAIVLLAAVAAASVREFLLIDGAAQSLKDNFADLKNSFAIAFSPLIEFAIPYIQAVISWLIKLFNTIAMVVGAFLGQTEVWQAVEGGTAQAAKNADALAKNTEKAGKKAKGALAAFDRINVLQKKDDKEKGPGAGLAPTGLGTAAFEKVAIDPEIISRVEAFKEKIREIISTVRDWFRRLWSKISEWALIAWDNIKAVWSVAADWFMSIFTPVLEFYKSFWTRIGIIAFDAWLTLVFIWKNIAGWFMTNVIIPLVGMFRFFWNWLVTNVVNPLGVVFKPALDGIKNAFIATFSFIGLVVKAMVNGMILTINAMIRGVVNGINSIISSINNLAGIVPGFITIPTVQAVQIPRLATGAVIPPNAQFAAILGDQKSGRNIEAPESLIRQIVREETAGQGEQTFTVVATGPMGPLIRMLNLEIKKDDNRLGGSLISGGSVA